LRGAAATLSQTFRAARARYINACKQFHKHSASCSLCTHARVFGYQAWKAQTKPFALDSTATRSFLAQRVDVYEQRKIPASSVDGITAVDFITAQPVQRLQFLRMYAVWFAKYPLGSTYQFTSTKRPINSDVSAALDIIEQKTSTAEDMDNAYLDYMQQQSNTDLGFYAKDTEVQQEFMVSFSLHPVSSKFTTDPLNDINLMSSGIFPELPRRLV
jgi:hypothetical protein